MEVAEANFSRIQLTISESAMQGMGIPALFRIQVPLVHPSPRRGKLALSPSDTSEATTKRPKFGLLCSSLLGNRNTTFVLCGAAVDVEEGGPVINAVANGLRVVNIKVCTCGEA
jgi:hypothetical protein